MTPRVMRFCAVIAFAAYVPDALLAMLAEDGRVPVQLEEICAWQVRRLMMDDRCCLAAADLEISPPWSDRLLFQFIIR